MFSFTITSIPDTSFPNPAYRAFRGNFGQLALPHISGDRHIAFGTVCQICNQRRHRTRRYENTLCHIAAQEHTQTPQHVFVGGGEFRNHRLWRFGRRGSPGSAYGRGHRFQPRPFFQDGPENPYVDGGLRGGRRGEQHFQCSYNGSGIRARSTHAGHGVRLHRTLAHNVRDIGGAKFLLDGQCFPVFRQCGRFCHRAYSVPYHIGPCMRFRVAVFYPGNELP